MGTIGVTVFEPQAGSVLTSGQPFQVAGGATGRPGLESMGIDSVTVGFLGGNPVEADLKQVKNPQVPTFSYVATLTAPVEAGPREIVVTATADDGATKATATVTALVQSFVPPPATKTPQQSLVVSVVNPGPPSSGDWAEEIVNANRSDVDLTVLDQGVWLVRHDQYPVCSREWNQVTAPTEDYDRDPVGFSGWLLEPELSGADVPFTHPFGADWECLVALDDDYVGLLAAGNIVPDDEAGQEAMAAASDLGIPVPDGGLLAVETDSLCVPHALHPPFGDVVRVGDRIAVFGRWIVDAGHAVNLDTDPGGPDPGDLVPDTATYRSEVHPPLLMAIGGTRVIGPGDARTRIVLTSRPFLVRQVYTTDTDTIADDHAPDDGTLLDHLDREITKLRPDPWKLGFPDSATIEVHPKIAAKPFDGVHAFRFTVQPPDAPGVAGPDFGVAEVSFRFTCRSGVGVQVIGTDELVPDPSATGFPKVRREARVDVLVGLSSAGYQPPHLPARQEYTPDRAQLEDAALMVNVEEIATLFLLQDPVAVANVEQALFRGMKTDKYDVPQVDLMDRSGGVPFVNVTQIPSGSGVVVDDDQPYPVFGVLEVRWHRPDVVFGGTAAEPA